MQKFSLILSVVSLVFSLAVLFYTRQNYLNAKKNLKEIKRITGYKEVPIRDKKDGAIIGGTYQPIYEIIDEQLRKDAIFKSGQPEAGGNG